MFSFLQVGLAVGDTEKMKKLATVKRLVLQIEYHIEIEESYPRFITQAVYEDFYDDKPNKHSMLHRCLFPINTGMRSGSQCEFTG